MKCAHRSARLHDLHDLHVASGGMLKAGLRLLCLCVHVLMSVVLMTSPNVFAGHEDKFYNNKVVQMASGAYAHFDCTCFTATGARDQNCPQLHDNTVFTPDGTMGNVCGKTLAQLQAEGFDLGTAVSKWPSDDEMISWARELLSLPTSA